MSLTKQDVEKLIVVLTKALMMDNENEGQDREELYQLLTKLKAQLEQTQPNSTQAQALNPGLAFSLGIPDEE